MKEKVDIKNKLGYAHHVEMEEIKAKLKATGIEDNAFLHFEAVRQYEERHKNDLSFAQKQALARANGEKWVTPFKSEPSLLDRYKAALEAIRDGHNNPRELAQIVLENSEEK